MQTNHFNYAGFQINRYAQSHTQHSAEILNSSGINIFGGNIDAGISAITNYTETYSKDGRVNPYMSTDEDLKKVVDTYILKQAPVIFTTIAAVIAEVRKIGHADQMNYAQFTALYQAMSTQEASIMQLINKMTIGEINKYVYKHSSSDSKKDMVSRLWDSLIGSFNLSGMISYSPFGGSGPATYEAALKLKMEAQTEQDYINYCTEEQAKRDLNKKAVTNPETLEEFRIFLTYRKPETMTAEQKIKYDELITDGKQAQREVNKKGNYIQL